MFLPARQAVSTLFAASSQSSRFIVRTPFYRLPSQSRCLVPSTFRSFSSFRPRAYQAVAENDLPSEAGQQEYTQFAELATNNIISPRVIDTITNRMNIHTMTEVQRMTINHCLDGADVIAQAKTGTGKTLAFLLPIVQRLLRDKELDVANRRQRASTDVRALIISPTRELAEQIAAEASKIVSNTAVKVQTAVGGTQKSFHLRKMQQEGCHILVGTPGRVLDIVSDRSSGVNLDNIETFVLDEADRLLDIGFAPAIADIQSYMPPQSQKSRQTLMFSATVPKSVVTLVRQTLKPDFKFIRTVDPDESPTHERIPQHVVFGKALQNQIPIIMEIAHNAIQKHKEDPSKNMPFKAIVYYGSTAEVALAFETIAKMRDPTQPRSVFQPHPLDPCRIFQMHGKLAQAQRTRESEGFRRSESGILISSDVTARGMDFPNVSHVIQVGLPKNSDDYVHRIGRTGRAGKSGEGWLILNDDERREIDSKMRNSGIDLKEAELVTGSLDMTRGAQVPGHIAKLLKFVEMGVTSVPYNVKSATYMALLGVLQQQNPGRPKQAQVDLMNDLAKYGWGLKEPPAVSARLISKIGFGRTTGLKVEEERPYGRDNDSNGFGRADRYGDRFNDRNKSENQHFGGRRDDPFSQNRAPTGKGVFGGGNGDPFDQMGMGGGRGGDRRGGRR